MRFAVLSSPDSWYLRDLRRAAADRHEVVCVPFTAISARLEGGLSARRGGAVLSSGTDLALFDAILVRTMPAGSLEQVVFRMDVLARLHAAGRLVVNPPRTIEIAVDKYLASSLLVEAGLDHPRTIVCQTVDDAMQAFAELGNDVVVKPLFGAEGRGIARVSDEAVALRVFKALAPLGCVLYVQQFIPHRGYDCRVFVLGERVLGMKRTNATDWRTNVSRGAKTEPLEVTPELADIARRATAATGAIVAGVDILPGVDGRLYAIEVNAVPGWQALARTLGVDVAAMVLDEVIRRVGR